MTELRINDPDNFMLNAANHMCAILDTIEDVEQVANELTALGYGDAIKVFHGEEGARILDVDGSEHGWFGRFRRTMQGLSDVFIPILREAEELVLEGKYGIAIPVHNNTQKEKIVEILKNYKGTLISFFGEFAITGYW